MLKIYKLLAIVLPFIIVQTVAAQSVKISGVVTAKSDGLPLPGVSISVKGTSTGTQTNTDGKFTISANINDVLKVTYIGFATQEIIVKQNEASLQIILQDAPNSLNEVVITALNISKDKKTLGYAIQGLKSKDIAEAKETNLVNALAGKIAGVNITNSQGDMG